MERSELTFSPRLDLHVSPDNSSPCYKYAATELIRLLGRIHIATSQIRSASTSLHCLRLALPNRSHHDKTPETSGVKWDGYILRIEKDEAIIAANKDKGALNGVYALARRLGFWFELPGSGGEWPPLDAANEIALECGECRINPRFPWRGIHEGCGHHDFTPEEWVRFYAKLGFNALANDYGLLELCKQCGIRLETGGHDFKKLIPRERFDEEPELFRMFQPEDFRGTRQPDSNACVTNPRTVAIIKENFKQRLCEQPEAYAIHTWGDDLPGGGWCLCPSCRALLPTDQALLAMRHLVQAAREEGAATQIPVLAYHDTIFPGPEIEAPEGAFLLFAPRERCYGHALDDPKCRRNRQYLKALRQWLQKFDATYGDEGEAEPRHDSHTFEYYFDQLLFRGMHPFLPDVIACDMAVYEQHGIQSHMSLQTRGPAIAAEFNMHVFAHLHWDAELDADGAILQLAHCIRPHDPLPWEHYLRRKADIFQNAMRLCEHEFGSYFDYRWLPETNDSEFGREIAQTYQAMGLELLEAAEELQQAVHTDASPRNAASLRGELGRAQFEAAELIVMSFQQQAMNRLGRYYNTQDPADAQQGAALLRQAIEAQEIARQQAVEAGLPEEAWYFKMINGWLKQEFERKADRYATSD
ncbi:DUF4838 domain-containing protein [Candidatus Sumerlaeota bacterium]|nr:DUF4838 domain-containing protein [Candidatus Sumerlaeota bacterium]